MELLESSRVRPKQARCARKRPRFLRHGKVRESCPEMQYRFDGRRLENTTKPGTERGTDWEQNTEEHP